ncbi:hypothetical protein [Streptomyces sp. NP-1717]|uniref:hypothetical protein n=1 Tax=Streptomyces sp. NP-1717 TaxID=2704470 RepID=UPI001F5D441C|nr:hypothetical protein [Streptomyces sp. NP-1717]MCI3225063.1 hypothetical protein [Streptomyces sp. NP-1717]
MAVAPDRNGHRWGWSFVLRLNQPLTPEQADAFDHCDAFADGSVSYTLGPDDPHRYAHRPDPAELSELICDVEAPSLLDAIAQVARDIRLIPGLRATGVRYDDTVTLAEAAQRSGRSLQSLAGLSRGRHVPIGFPDPASDTEGTVFYSWREIADFLRSIGDTVPEAPRELAVADQVLPTA